MGKLVPNTFRVVCDGDMITANPSAFLGYVHVGIASVFDKHGSIVIDPSLIEKRFGLSRRTKPSCHSTTSYSDIIKRAYYQVDSEKDMLEIMNVGYVNNPWKVFIEVISELKMRCCK